MSKSMVRSVKNVTKGYSNVQVKVRNATSNDPWGPSGTDMGEIAQMTYNNSTDFYEIMDMLDKRMNDKGKNWRHVLKSLKVLDYCLHEGSEVVVTWARKNIFIIKTLREFQHVDEEGRDVGANVRHSAKELTSLILDEERLRAERHQKKLWKKRVTGLDEFAIEGGQDAGRRRKPQRNSSDDDLEFKMALEASKNQEEEDRKRRGESRGGGPSTETDDELAKALKLSREEEELRKRELEDQNASNLFDFDSTPSQPQQSQPTGFNQGYQQQPAVDWYGNPLDQQSTGFLNNAYAQPTGMQPQQTGFPNGYGYGSNNPYQQPQHTAQFQQPQNTFMQPQQTGFGMNNPYAQQSMQPQQTVQPQEQPMPTGSNNPWGQTANGLDNLKPQPTGSNNPFATQVSRPQQTVSAQRAPTLSTLQEQKTATFNGFGGTPSPFSQPQQQQQQQQPTSSFPSQPMQQPAQTGKPVDPHRANLNQLLASSDGQDTFGNTGDMRIPAQHTAPSQFVNSAGSSRTGISAQQTGNNPFLNSQYTGMPQQSHMQPAQTGPAMNFGGGNPFGQNRQQAGGNNLIDL
ncbi:MAG: hypothetical protein Q9159_000477 [Coniocarpon cinnabarinum]